MPLDIYSYLDYIPPVPSTEGVFMRRHDGGTGCGSRGQGS
jgi:hypothetical protein